MPKKFKPESTKNSAYSRSLGVLLDSAKAVASEHRKNALWHEQRAERYLQNIEMLAGGGDPEKMDLTQEEKQAVSLLSISRNNEGKFVIA